MAAATEILRPPVISHSFRAHQSHQVFFTPPSSVVRAIFFDFDDTLLPSTFLAQNGCLRLDADVPPFVQQQLKVISAAVVCLLNVACEAGSFVCIITNSETGWVELATQKFMPDVVPLLSQCTILSARSTYERMFPGSPMIWKKSAFKDMLARAYADSSALKNILSFGDSQSEREAMLAAGHELLNARTKVVKLVERPSIEQLRTQLDLIVKCFAHLATYEAELDLMLSLTRVESQ